MPSAPPTYVPAILTRHHELRALRDVSPAARRIIQPLFVVAPPAWDFVDDAPLVDPSEHLRAVPELLGSCWRGTALVDLRHVGHDVAMSDGIHGIVWLAQACQRLGVTLRPVLPGAVLGGGAAADALPQYAEVASWDRRGLALRLERDEWPSVVGPRSLQRLVEAAGLESGECDLLLDLGDEPAHDAATAADLVRYELATVPSARSWRSIVVLSTSRPDGRDGRRRRGRRHEWHLHRQLVVTGEMPGAVFGDYVLGHPDPFADLESIGGPHPDAIHYTTDDSWLCVPREPVPLAAASRHGSARHDLMLPAMAVRVRGDREFRAGHCAFERLIDEMVASRHEPIGPPTLRRLATHHHFELVAEQLLALHEAMRHRP